MNRSKLLRRTLIANAAFSLLSGLALLLFSGAIAGAIGLANPVVLTVLGIGLVIFGTDVAFLATRERINPTFARIVSIADFTWVAASVALLIGWPETLNGTGHALVIAAAVAVDAFGTLQWIGLKRQRADEAGARVTALPHAA